MNDKEEILNINLAGMSVDDVEKELKENLTEEMSKEETLDDIDRTFGQEELYGWSTYILPNGHFLNPDTKNAQEYWDDIDDEAEGEHSDFIYYEYNSYGEDLFSDCIKMNVTYPYLILPSKLTSQQITAFRKIIENWEDIFTFDINEDDFEDADNIEKLESMNNPIYIEQNYKGHLFDLSVYSADDILKALKNAQRTGVFESLIKPSKIIVEEVKNKDSEQISDDLNESNKNHNTFKYKNKAYWCGSVNLLDGEIEEVHTYGEAENEDFHHSFYFSEQQLEKMENNECAFFFVDDNNKIKIDPIGRDEIDLKLEKTLIDEIKSQITFINNSKLNESITDVELYHGTDTNTIKQFDKEINWLTTSHSYAESYALMYNREIGYIYHCNLIKSIKCYDLNDTGIPVYSMIPTSNSYNQDFLNRLSKLNLTEDEINNLIKMSAEEYDYKKDKYGRYTTDIQMRLSTIARSKAFKDILQSKGYSGILAIEYDKVSSRYVRTIGVFDSSCIKINSIEEVKIN